MNTAGRLLHFAPEYCLEKNLRDVQESAGRQYVTADLSGSGVDLQVDLTDTQLESHSFDAIICSHVLEHIEDDRAALRELNRITKPGGWCLVAVPLDLNREETYEDETIQLPADRARAFWQEDHVRVYAPDIVERIREAGFSVETLRPRSLFGNEELRRHGLLDSDWMFLCVK